MLHVLTRSTLEGSAENVENAEVERPAIGRLSRRAALIAKLCLRLVYHRFKGSLWQIRGWSARRVLLGEPRFAEGTLQSFKRDAEAARLLFQRTEPTCKAVARRGTFQTQSVQVLANVR